jgi:hypothetical protein
VNIGSLLRRLVDAFDEVGIPYMIAGSFASGLHGAPRPTLDVDIVVDPSGATLERFVASLDPQLYYADIDAARSAFRTRGMFNVIDMTTGWKVDVIIRKHRPFSVEELSRRRLAQIAGVAVYVASPEDTVIAKLEWSKAGGGSERQRRDVAEIVAAQGATLDRAYIERWVAELDLDDEWALVRD